MFLKVAFLFLGVVATLLAITNLMSGIDFFFVGCESETVPFFKEMELGDKEWYSKYIFIANLLGAFTHKVGDNFAGKFIPCAIFALFQCGIAIWAAIMGLKAICATQANRAVKSASLPMIILGGMCVVRFLFFFFEEKWRQDMFSEFFSKKFELKSSASTMSMEIESLPILPVWLHMFWGALLLGFGIPGSCVKTEEDREDYGYAYGAVSHF